MSQKYAKLFQFLLPVVLLAGLLSAISDAADPLLRQYYTDERGTLRLYSRAVVTEGGSTVWLAGQTTLEDAEGNSISGDFDAQVRENFRLIATHLDQFGGDIHDIVTMTVYVADVRNADEYLVAKEEVFGEGPYPSSAFIGVSGFSRSGVEVEVKAVAVVGDESG
jgi:enamine deaminase RidA (YjgF/YER057c/UK114 family)